MKALITGGAGFIGSNLAKTLLDKGYEVMIIDDLSSGYKENIPSHSDFHFIKGSITNEEILERGFSYQPDVVFHLAVLFANQNSVEHPLDDLWVNGFGTLKVLEAAKKCNVNRIIYSSSSCVYGDSDLPLREGSMTHLETPYAITKLLGEHYCLYYHRYYDIPITILRYFNNYGPGERPGVYRNVIPNFIKLAMEGKPLPITGSGQETRSFTYVEDTVRATILAVEKVSAVGQVINIGTEKETKIIDLARMINEITGNQAGVEHRDRRKWDKVTRRSADITKAKEVLDFEPKIGLRDGLPCTVEWLRQIQIEENKNK